MRLGFALCWCLIHLGASRAVCLDRDPTLIGWNPGHNPENRVLIGRGRRLLLVASATVHSLHILHGGRLVIADGLREPLVLRARHVLVELGGELHVGSEGCPYRGSATLVLYGRSDEEAEPADPQFGRKFVGVGPGGTLELHGERKLSWTLLNRTLLPPPGAPGDSERGAADYDFERSWGHRGLVVHAIAPTTGEVLWVDRFDTHRRTEEGKRLVSALSRSRPGTLLAVAVNDEAARDLEGNARAALSALGARHAGQLAFRNPWALVVVQGDPSTAVEAHATYQGERAPVSAAVSALLRTRDGADFSVSAVSEWAPGPEEWSPWLARPGRSRGPQRLFELQALHRGLLCDRPSRVEVRARHGAAVTELQAELVLKSLKVFGFSCRPRARPDSPCPPYLVRFLCPGRVWPRVRVRVQRLHNCSVLEVADDARSWRPGDEVVVSSTDFSMHQAERFSLLPCPECGPRQLKAAGLPRYAHVGGEVDGVDMRAEVALLTRGVVIAAETQPRCYADNLCHLFAYDTFGGHIKVEAGFRSVHIEGVELRHMGQQLLGHYPVHFHLAGDVDALGGYEPPTYVRSVTVRHSFSRCVTIHATSGLLVEDVVGYDILGHCFFLEDGPEQRNTLRHCVGLLVKPGSLLPSDRDGKMCRAAAALEAFPGYEPRPRQDCSAVSTFWISNPNNNVIDCAAAGSEEVGFWFIFHHVATGLSAGSYPPGYTEHLPLGEFTGNRAHSNYRAGMILDHGVKTTEPNERDKRPYLSIVGARYGPHEDADPRKPRVPALIQGFTAFKNQQHGAWLRGGDVRLDHCQFADNGIGLTLASGGTFPDDEGSMQEVRNSLFVGESGNLGTPGGPGAVAWGPGGTDGKNRTLPRARNFPMRGLQVYDGPILVRDVLFRRFAALGSRLASAIGFRLNNSWQSCPQNNVTGVRFEDVPLWSRVFFGRPGPWFHRMELDGDRTAIFRDSDGSVSGFPGAFLLRHDNFLLRNPDCLDVPDWRAALCSGRYAQLYIQARNPAWLRLRVVRNDYPGRGMTLEGALSRGGHYQQYQPVVALRRGYTLHWDGPAPEEVTIWPINFDRAEWVLLALCYPRGTAFSVVRDVHERRGRSTRKVGAFSRAAALHKLSTPALLHGRRDLYYWDEDAGLLFLRVRSHFAREGHAFCSVHGCERVKVKAHLPHLPHAAAVADCEARAYPKYATVPVAQLPMPRRLARRDPDAREEFVEVKLESHSLRYKRQYEYAVAVVDGVSFAHAEDGLQLLVLDGGTGKVAARKTFDAQALRHHPGSLQLYVTRGVRDGSVVLLTSRGHLLAAEETLRTKVLPFLGAEVSSTRLHDRLVFVGYKGPVRPDWVRLVSDRYSAKLHQLITVPPRRQ
ncbi:cell migration-inducing and hyaluronan-binding protein-like [Lethenteron reissneri]|uniref:cell migration-inducing and hyaluronan-binding protein-like n=1 Tax=Lethenteron reissneri TaxID=7753 RepID=UPI002AB7020C|nr:cell migration-inducing and hyaluronan-binding protein-like [Lethenteron reissneri]XP_061409352.1 cell migration-inducing and hyaluronan-binding protein-like [Lethenteron reissneri]XP_061409353.1 cell migration-inducing and hyaluronan-binding protein-like [Lethenteron reissneri]